MCRIVFRYRLSELSGELCGVSSFRTKRLYGPNFPEPDSIPPEQGLEGAFHPQVLPASLGKQKTPVNATGVD